MGHVVEVTCKITMQLSLIRRKRFEKLRNKACRSWQVAQSLPDVPQLPTSRCKCFAHEGPPTDNELTHREASIASGHFVNMSDMIIDLGSLHNRCIHLSF